MERICNSASAVTHVATQSDWEKHSLLLFLPLYFCKDIQFNFFFSGHNTLFFYFVWSRFISLYHDDDKCMVIHVHFVAWICVSSSGFVSGKYSNWVHLAVEMSHRIFIEIPSAITKKSGKRGNMKLFSCDRELHSRMMSCRCWGEYVWVSIFFLVNACCILFMGSMCKGKCMFGYV